MMKQKQVLVYLIGLILFFLSSEVAAQCNCNHIIKASDWHVDGKAIGVKPGDRVCFENGTRLNIELVNMTGTAANPVIISNRCDGKVIIKGSTSVTTPFGINIYNSSNFRFTGTNNSSEEYGIEITGTHMGLDVRDLSTDFEVDHVKIHDVGSVAFVGKTDPTCDSKTWRGNFTMRNVKFHHNYASNTADEGFYVGNSHYTNGVTKTCNGVSTKLLEHDVIGVDIHDNIVLNTGRDGIQVGGAISQCAIHDNRIENVATRAIYGHQSGIQINEGTVANIYNNTVIKGTGFGIFVSGSGGSRVVNNLVTDHLQGGLFANDFPPYYTNVSYTFINNTLINNKDYGIYMLSEHTVNNMFANNIIVATNQSGYQYVKLNNPSKISWTEKNNIKTADMASVKFVNPSAKDYHLQSSSPEVNTGFNASSYGVTIDLDGISRPTGGSFDIGAYEFNSGGSSSPTANAGADKTITLPTNSTSFTGSGTDPGGSIASYAWTKKSGGAATLTNANTATLSVSGLVAGTYVFTLTVTDNSGAKGSDDVTLTVNAASGAPTANAGADKTITLPTNSASFTGSGTDTGGSIASYAWTKKSGGTATLTNANTATLSVSALVAGSYTFTLTVTDNSGAKGSDDVVLTVNAAGNIAPTANAGADKSITLPTNSTSFTGSGADSDGTITSYSWHKKSGGAATLTNANTKTVSISGLVAGTYVFTLTVTDNSGKTTSDDVTLTVNASSGATPTANAGADKTITLPLNYTTFQGSGTDSDGTISSYVWTKKSGGTVMLANANTSKLGVSGVLAGTYTFTLTVTDNSGKKGTDDVVLTVNGVGNIAPTANAGADKAITLPTNSTTLTGSGADSDGTITSYSWHKKSGGAATLANANTKTVSISALVAGSYVFTLTVTDNSGKTTSDDMTLTVNTSTNVAPTVSAGSDKSTTLPVNLLVLNGSATDPDGTINSYSWSKVSGGSSVLTNATTPAVTVTGLTQGTYEFKLTATDNKGAASSDVVNVVVSAATVSQFNFTNTAENVSGWTNVAGSPHMSLITVTDPLSKYTISSVSTSQWKPANYNGTLTTAYNGGVTTGTVQPADIVETFWVNYNSSYGETVGGVLQGDNIRIANLNPTHKYKLQMGASRKSGASGGDQYGYYEYRINGTSQKTLLVTNNATRQVEYTDIAPNAQGQIGISARKIRGSGMNYGYIGWLVIIDVTANPSQAAASATAREASDTMELTEQDIQSQIEETPASTEEDFVFMDQRFPGGFEYAVTIFDENGGKLYHGPWSPELSNQVFGAGGLFIYHILQNGVKIHTGKIYLGR